MALIELRAEFGKLVAVLERIARALERAHPEKQAAGRGPQVTEQDLGSYDEEQEWQREIEAKQATASGYLDAQD